MSKSNRQRAVKESQTQGRRSDGSLDRSAAKWVALADPEGTRNNRQHALRWWLISNGLWTSRNPRFAVAKDHRAEYWEMLDKRVDTTVGMIRSGKLEPYGSVNKLIDWMKKGNRSSGGIFNSRALVLKFLRYSLPGVTYESGNDYVKKVRRIRVLASKLPTPDQIRGVMLGATLKVKVMISTMISTGGRLNEILNIRMDDLDLVRKPAIAYLRGETTKTGYSRIAFLSSETVMLMLDYLKIRPADHRVMFDGYDPTKSDRKYDLDKPMTKHSAWLSLRRAFKRLGMNERTPQGRYYYHSNTLRALSLSIMKSNGYPADWAEYLVGHSIGTQRSYLPPTDLLGQEWLKIDPQFCFLGDPRRYEGSITNRSLILSSGTPDSSDATRSIENQARAPTSMNSVKPDEPVSTKRWASFSYYYVKTSIMSTDYDQALADGYSLFDSRAGGIRVLRKRRRGTRVREKSSEHSPADLES